MAKVTVTNRIDRVSAKLVKAIRSATTLKMVATFMRDRIYQYTKRGQSLVLDSKLAPLSEGYVASRRRALKGSESKTLKKLGLKKTAKKLAKQSFGPFFGPARSNLTYTGQMLEALKSRVDAGDGKVSVFVQDTSRKDDDLTNAEVAVKVAKDGRPFLGLDRVGVDRIRRMVIAELRRSLKRR